jgi:hypothetical protein
MKLDHFFYAYGRRALRQGTRVIWDCTFSYPDRFSRTHRNEVRSVETNYVTLENGNGHDMEYLASGFSGVKDVKVERSLRGLKLVVYTDDPF